MNQLKPGYEKISHHIEHLVRQPWLAKSQEFWPRYLFHFTDITNAGHILANDILHCREILENSGPSFIDIAGPQIIKETPQIWKQYVRLYFRPRTPMQYRNEGIRPKEKLELDAHCPVPVILVFDAKKILTLQTTQFSNGNLRANRVKVSGDTDFYLNLPFEKIYHDSGLHQLNEDEKREIIFHRHAEVIIPKEMDLTGLRYIFCRSHAEFETLINLLPSRKRIKWRYFIRIEPTLFFKDWFFVKKASLNSSSVTFSISTVHGPSSFHARVEIEHPETKEKYSWQEQNYNPKEILTFNLSNLSHPDYYKISFYLDNHLAYQNIYRDESGIF